jgi:helix-turn-helix, Psq domain.
MGIIMKFTSSKTRKIAIIAVINKNLSPEKAAEIFKVNPSTIYR